MAAPAKTGAAKIEHTMTPDELWIKSEDYLQSLAGDWPDQVWKMFTDSNWRKLTGGETRSKEDDDFPEIRVDATFMSIRTSFLFPQLDDAQRVMLLAAWLASRGVTIGVNSNPVPEDALKVAEPQFVEASAMVDMHVIPCLSDSQKQIVKEHYLKVHFKT